MIIGEVATLAELAVLLVNSEVAQISFRGFLDPVLAAQVH